MRLIRSVAQALLRETNTLDRWVNTMIIVTNLSVRRCFEVIEVLSNIVVLDDYDNEYIVIVSNTEKSNLLLDGYTRYTTYCIDICSDWFWIRAGFSCEVRNGQEKGIVDDGY